METLTNQYFNYRETPANYDGTGTLTDIKGNTLGWNQLVKSARGSTSSSGINFTNNGDGSWRIDGTASNDIGYNIDTGDDRPTAISGHKYLLKGCPSGGSRSTYYLYIGGTIDSADTGDGVIFTSSLSGAIGISIRVGSGTQLDKVFKPMFFDLTAMGLDSITTPEEFTSLFPLSYYSYNTGSLLSFNGSGLKTTGKNLLDINSLGEYNISSGSYLPVSYSGRVGNSTAIDVSNVDTVTVSYLTGIPSTSLLYSLLKANNTKVSRVAGGTSPTTIDVSNADKLYVCLYASENLAVSDVIYLNVYNGESTLSLPISTYFPTGMKSAGSVYDELTPSKATTRIGSVDLGSLEWTYDSGIARFQASFVGYKLRAIRTVPLATPIYECKWHGESFDSNWNMVIYANDDNTIFIHNHTYTDATTFKNAMDGVNMYFEKSAYTETTIDPPLDLTYSIWDDGTEQLLPENTSVPTTTPILCDIDYRTMIPVTADNDPDGAGVITGTGNYRYHSIATLEATPTDEIYRFLRWEDENGDTVSTNSTYSFKVGE